MEESGESEQETAAAMPDEKWNPAGEHSMFRLPA